MLSSVAVISPMARESKLVSKDRSSPDSLSVELIVSVNKILNHPGRVTLKTEELFVVFHHRIQGREGDP